MAKHEHQVLYMDRWVSREHFRTYVYSETEKRIANSWDEYLKLIESGLWFNTPEIAFKKANRKGRKPTDVDTDS